ncbi:hypothetical protein [Streptomyces sp. NBC_00878]|uniref:hypothetical protein n=1 Tax=Streptomyces sp. NBC_00878 TaxID=2975854 RepID=UPI0022503328|nr:hypothetical protein [Streptomyces sp. NBC_00878]MCX4905455.1 hypothetical protein [Streptomyces sp. NBC_00878]
MTCPGSNPRDHQVAEQSKNYRYSTNHQVVIHAKRWKILRDCRLKGDGVDHAMLSIARLHNLAPTS